MRKLLSIACVAIVVATLASCKKTYVTNVAPVATWSNPISASQWAQTTDGKSDSVDIAVKGSANFFQSNTDATLVYFSFLDKVWEQIPEVYNGVSYSYIHYVDNTGELHLVLYSQPVNGGTPVKPSDTIYVKLVAIQSN